MSRHILWIIPLIVALVIALPAFVFLSQKKMNFGFVGMQTPTPVPTTAQKTP